MRTEWRLTFAKAESAGIHVPIMRARHAVDRALLERGAAGRPEIDDHIRSARGLRMLQFQQGIGKLHSGLHGTYPGDQRLDAEPFEMGAVFMVRCHDDKRGDAFAQRVKMFSVDSHGWPRVYHP